LSRAELQQLAADRILDAQALLTAQRWSGAYHLVGYAVECGLKSCILAHLDRTGILFKDRNYLKSLADCWTHELDKLVGIAGLTAELGIACGANRGLAGYWGVAKDWKETPIRAKNRSGGQRALRGNHARSGWGASMDTYTLVENRIDDGRKLINLLNQKGFALSAVCWVKTSEEGDWYLYIATPVVDQKGAADAYREVYGVLTSISGTSVSVSDVKLVGANNPITKDILGIRERYPGKHPTFSRRSQLGSVAVDEGYIYPLGPTPEVLTSLGQPIPEILTDLGQGVGPDEYIEIPYLKPSTAPGGNAMPTPSVLRLKKKEIRTFEVLTGLQVIEGRRFSTFAKVSTVDDGVIGVDYRVEEIKH